jgi:hypothetical protein
MKTRITQENGFTHLEWEHELVTAKMLDWFWSNMEKGILLWHPEEHEPLTWAVPVTPGNPIGAVHIAPQTWADGRRQNIYIRFEDPSLMRDDMQALVEYDHCIVAAGLGFGPEALDVDEPFGYRIHQWQATDFGIVGRSTAAPGSRTDTPEMGLVWAQHCAQEVGNWGVFLPQLYELYRVVTNPLYNPYADLSVERIDGAVRYRDIPAVESPVA